MCFAFCDIIMNTLCMTKQLVLLWISPFPEYVEQTFYWHCRIFKQQRRIWGCYLLLFWKVLMFERFLPLTEAKKMYVSINGQSPPFLLVRYCCTQTIAGLAVYSSLKKYSLKSCRKWNVCVSERKIQKWTNRMCISDLHC